MPAESKDLFLAEVESRLKAIYTTSRLGQKVSPVDKHRCEGFMHAGVVMGVASNEELRELMETLHCQIFKQTISEREKAMASVWKEDAPDYSQYELSPLVRSGSSQA